MRKITLSILTICLLLANINVDAQTDLITLVHKNAPPRKTIKLPGGRAVAPPPGPFQANCESIKANYPVPEWIKDGKFGIFMQFGVYTVPAHGSEWHPHYMYNNQEFTNEHTEHFSAPDVFGYKDFIPLFKAEKFDADDWANLFKKAVLNIFVQQPSTMMVLLCTTANSRIGTLPKWGRTKILSAQDESGLKVTFPNEKPCHFAYSLKVERDQ